MEKQDNLEQVYENMVFEITRAKFEKEIKRAKGNRNRLTNLKMTIDGMAGTMLSTTDAQNLIKQIDSYL